MQEMPGVMCSSSFSVMVAIVYRTILFKDLVLTEMQEKKKGLEVDEKVTMEPND